MLLDGSTLVDVNEHQEEYSVLNYELEQNYPNPFNPSTLIKYTIPVVDGKFASVTIVMLKVYDILGKEVSTLVNKKQVPGVYTVKFDAANLPTGIYFYKLQIHSSLQGNDFTQSKKMIFLK